MTEQYDYRGRGPLRNILDGGFNVWNPKTKQVEPFVPGAQFAKGGGGEAAAAPDAGLQYVAEAGRLATGAVPPDESAA